MNKQQRYHRVGKLFRAACGLPTEQRPIFLDGQCGSDESLKKEVLALLAEDSGPTSILNRPPLGKEIHLSQVVSAVVLGPPGTPQTIGRPARVASAPHVTPRAHALLPGSGKPPSIR